MVETQRTPLVALKSVFCPGLPKRQHRVLSHVGPHVLKPDTEIVYRAFNCTDTSLLDCVNYEEDHRSWGGIANDFVLNMGKQRIKTFVTTVHAAKIETERKLRFELDQKLMQMPAHRLNLALGKDFVARIRFYIMKYYADEEQRELKSQSSDYSPEHRNLSQSILSQYSPPSPKKSYIKSPAKKEEDEIGDSPEDILKNLSLLRRTARNAEQKLPLLFYKTQDDILQIKHFLLVYYLPILSKLDIDQLSDSVGNNKQRQIEANKSRRSQVNARPKLTDPKVACTKAQTVLKACYLQSGVEQIVMPNMSRSQRAKLSAEERLLSWAQYEQKRFEYLDTNLKHLQKDTLEMDEVFRKIRTLIASKKVQKRPAPVVKLVQQGHQLKSVTPIKKTEATELKSQTSQISSKSFARKLKARVLLISRTQLDILNPKLKTPFDIELDDYMGKRGSLLGQRYGEGGKGFHHERVYKVREPLKIESLQTPPLHIQMSRRSTKQTERAQVTRSTPDLSFTTIDRLNAESPLKDEQKRQRMGYSFLSFMPTLSRTLEDIDNKQKDQSPSLPVRRNSLKLAFGGENSLSRNSSNFLGLQSSQSIACQLTMPLTARGNLQMQTPKKLSSIQNQTTTSYRQIPQK